MGIDGLQDRLKEARLRLGLTQHEVGERAGIRAPTITRYEKGDNLPSATALIGLSEALGVNVEWLLTGRQTMVPEATDAAQREPAGLAAYLASGEASSLSAEEREALGHIGRAMERAGRVPAPFIFAALVGLMRTLPTVATSH